jgi:rhamnose utilization protein RhaD (predicted bifunctional aldolase and dehydrogenase)
MGIIELLRDLGVFGLLMWFIQLLLSKSADRKFETYKSELSQKTQEFQSLLDSKLELYKVELNLQNYKATKIYEQQLSIIIELHRKLIKLNQTMAMMSVALMTIVESNEVTEKKEVDQVAKAGVCYDDFNAFYQDNIIFIPTNTTNKIDNIIREYSQNFSSYISQRGTKNEITFEQARNIAQKIINEIKPALEQLTFDFRRLLGVEIEI